MAAFAQKWGLTLYAFLSVSQYLFLTTKLTDNVILSWLKLLNYPSSKTNIKN